MFIFDITRKSKFLCFGLKKDSKFSDFFQFSFMFYHFGAMLNFQLYSVTHARNIKHVEIQVHAPVRIYAKSQFLCQSNVWKVVFVLMILFLIMENVLSKRNAHVMWMTSNLNRDQ